MNEIWGPNLQFEPLSPQFKSHFWKFDFLEFKLLNLKVQGSNPIPEIYISSRFWGPRGPGFESHFREFLSLILV